MQSAKSSNRDVYDQPTKEKYNNEERKWWEHKYRRNNAGYSIFIEEAIAFESSTALPAIPSGRRGYGKLATDMGQVKKYKRKIIAVLALVTAMASGLEIKYYREAPVAVTGKQYWHNVGNIQNFQENIPSNLETQSSTRINDEQDRQNSDQQRPSKAFIGRTDVTNERRHSFNLGSMITNLKCPSLKISLDLLSSHNCERSSMERCIVDKCRKQIEKWSIQQPFYVDEPTWVEIELDYSDKLPYNFKTKDPFFVTRGKKILETIEARNDDGSNDNEDYREKLLDEVTTSIKSSQLDDRDKRNGSKRKEDRRKALQINNRQLQDLVKHLDPIKDPFFLSRGKKRLVSDTIRRVSIDDLETEIIGRKSHEEMKRSVRMESKRLESNESSEVTNSSADSLPIDNDNATSSESNTTTTVSFRIKRNSCTGLDCTIDDSEKTIPWMNDPKKTIFDSSYVRRRDKHSDIPEIFNDPFFISRGKKGSKNIDYKPSSGPTDSSSSLEAFERVLRRLLDTEKCNSKACKDLEKFIAQTYETMRDRRSSFDDLLQKYDPFYVVRGKKMRSSNSFEKDQQRSGVKQQDERDSKDPEFDDF